MIVPVIVAALVNGNVALGARVHHATEPKFVEHERAKLCADCDLRAVPSVSIALHEVSGHSQMGGDFASRDYMFGVVSAFETF